MKKMIVAMAAVGLLILTVSVVQAETCYRLYPFADYLRLSVQIDEGATGDAHASVNGQWIARSGTTTSYTLPVVGSRELNQGSTVTRRLGLVGPNHTTTYFGNNRLCTLDGIVGGAFTITCVGGTGAIFRNSGTSLAPISCSGLSPSSASAADESPIFYGDLAGD